MEESSRKSLLQRIRLFESGRVSSVRVRRWDGDENLANVDIHSRVAYLERMLSEGRISRIQYDEQMKTLEERKRSRGSEEKRISSCGEENSEKNNECSRDGEIRVEDGNEVEENFIESEGEEHPKACSIDEDESDVSDSECQRTLGKVSMPKLPAACSSGLQRCGGYVVREESKTGENEESTSIKTHLAESVNTSNREDHEMKGQKHLETVSDALSAQDGAGRGSGTSECLEPSIASKQNPMDCNPEQELSCKEVTKSGLITPPADQPWQLEYSKGTVKHNIDDEGQNDNTSCVDSSLESTCTGVAEPSSDETISSCDDDIHPGIAALASCSGVDQKIDNIDTEKCNDNLICENTSPEATNKESGRCVNVLDCDEKAHTSAITAMNHRGTQADSIASVAEEQNDSEAHCENAVAHADLYQKADGTADSMHEDYDNTLSCDEHAKIETVTVTSSIEVEQHIKIVESNHGRDCKTIGDDAAACIVVGEGVSNRTATEYGSYEITLDVDNNSTKSTTISTDHLGVGENDSHRETHKSDHGELCSSSNVIDANGQSGASSIVPAVPCSYHDNIGCNACVSNGEIEFNTNHNKNYEHSTSADEASIINEMHSNSPAQQEQSHKEAVETVSFVAGCTPEDSTKGSSVIPEMPEKSEPDVYIINGESDCYSQAEDSYGAIRTRQLMMSEHVSVYCNEEKENQVEDENISSPEALHCDHSVGENGTCNKGCIRPRRGRWPVVAAAVGLVAVVSVRSGLGRI